jgi:integrase
MGRDTHHMNTTDTITVRGREFQLIKDARSGRWRIRKRTKDVFINQTTGCTDLAEAKKWARTLAEKALNNAYRIVSGGHTLEEVAAAYLSFPKAVRDYVAEANVARLRIVVREALGKELEEVPARSITYRLWEDYAAKRHGGKLDLSTPRRENIGIVAAIRSACSLFAKKLDHRYEEAGIRLDFANLRRVPSLPVLAATRSPLPDDVLPRLLEAWKELRFTDAAMYTAIGLALHAGLRSSEIRAAQRHWIAQQDMNVRVVLRDRPEEGFRTKGGPKADSWLSGLVLDFEFAAYLLGRPEGRLVVPNVESMDWFLDGLCNRWVRQFIPRELDGKGLHRLRSIYADNVKKRFEAQILARQAGVDAARLALNHGSAAVTLQHYLTA